MLVATGSRRAGGRQDVWVRLTLSWSERNTHPRAVQVVNAAGELRVGRECLVEERKHDDPDTQLSGSARQSPELARSRRFSPTVAGIVGSRRPTC